MSRGPVFAVPTALEYFAALVAEDDGLPLLEAAAAIAQDEFPALDTQAVLAEVDALAQRLLRRIPVDAGSLHRLQLLNRFFFKELGFAANVNDYYDPDNSYIHAVLAARRGIPVSLAVLFIELATQIGLTARPVSFPGHFLVKLSLTAGEVVIDPVNGFSLSPDELEQRLAPYRRRQDLVDAFDVPLGLFLQAAPAREVVARMLRNLKEIHRAGRDWLRLLAIQQRLVILLPRDWGEWRDRGLVLAELGQHGAAADDLAQYLDHCPDATDSQALLGRLRELRALGRPPLH